MMLVVAALALQEVLQPTRLMSIPFDSAFPAPGESTVKLVEKISPDFDFDEVIASWNVKQAKNCALDIEARAHIQGRATKWYHLASWSMNDSASPRSSIEGQGDSEGDVLTDTLRLKSLANSLDLRLTFKTVQDGPAPKLTLFTVSFCRRSKGAASESLPMKSEAWGKVIDVPQRAQGNYPRGSVLCSPTSLSMLLLHYSKQLNRPELDVDVPEVESMVWDPVYKGAGNWPFNTAFAGSFDGMRGYVTRLQGISDLEKWIAAGFPVICSVSFDMLRGKALSPTEQGHLVVLVGFEADGTPVLNDPAWKDNVRRSYKRSDFEKAWRYSNRTVYIVHPEGAKVPPSTGLWLDS